LSGDETVALVEEYIRLYNTKRLPKMLSQLSPDEFLKKVAA